MDLWNDVIERWRSAQRIIAIGAAVAPSEVDLISCRPPGDQAGLVNVMPFHLYQAKGGPLALQCRSRLRRWV